MPLVRLREQTKKDLQHYGTTFDDSVKALIVKANGKSQVDYDYIRQIVEDCFTKHLTK